MALLSRSAITQSRFFSRIINNSRNSSSCCRRIITSHKVVCILSWSRLYSDVCEFCIYLNAAFAVVYSVSLLPFPGIAGPSLVTHQQLTMQREECLKLNTLSTLFSPILIPLTDFDYSLSHDS